MGKTHQLKCHPEYFEALRNRTKMFECRKDDRQFEVGDSLELRCFDPWSNDYMPMGHLVREITYILRGPIFDLPEGLVIMSLK